MNPRQCRGIPSQNKRCTKPAALVLEGTPLCGACALDRLLGKREQEKKVVNNC